MVFHLFERFFGTFGDPQDRIWGNTTKGYLIENGFSEEEATNLAWFNGKENHWKFYGILGGLWTVWVLKPVWAKMRRTNPRFLYQPYWNPILKASVVFAGYLIGDYIGTSPLRRGANEQLSSLYNNNDYLVTREKFIRSFEPLNRKFTSDEINHFYAKKSQDAGSSRKWIYNPHIHGDKDAYEKATKNFDSQRPAYENPDVQARINEENRLKIEAGETVQQKPFDLNQIIDHTGEKQGIYKYPIFKGWRPLE